MKKFLAVLLAFVLCSSHDMYLKLDTYFLAPKSPAQIQLFNGTFEASENTIDRNRMQDVSLVGADKRTAVDTTQWSDVGLATILDFTTGQAGTWVAGVSTRARNIEMTAADFNNYLAHDGVVDMLDSRQANGTLEQDANEKYSKHVKTIFQVGDQLSDDWQTVLGYPIEFVPLQNPYSLHAGDELAVQLLLDGKALANQLVIIGLAAAGHTHEHEHEHGHEHSDGDADHHHHGDQQARTDENGILKLALSEEGIWYLRTIHMTHSDEGELTHESNWATLTFELGHGHSHDAHSHTHDEGIQDHSYELSSGIPGYVYWIGSLLLILGLFFWFNRQSSPQ